MAGSRRRRLVVARVAAGAAWIGVIGPRNFSFRFFFSSRLPAHRLVLKLSKKLPGGASYIIVREPGEVLVLCFTSHSEGPAELSGLPHMVQFLGRKASPCTFLGGGCSDFVAILPKLFTP